MPKLKYLEINGFSCKKLTLNDELTPKIKELNIGSNEAERNVVFDVKSSSLDKITMDYAQVEENIWSKF